MFPRFLFLMCPRSSFPRCPRSSFSMCPRSLWVDVDSDGERDLWIPCVFGCPGFPLICPVWSWQSLWWHTPSVSMAVHTIMAACVCVCVCVCVCACALNVPVLCGGCSIAAFCFNVFWSHDPQTNLSSCKLSLMTDKYCTFLWGLQVLGF